MELMLRLRIYRWVGPVVFHLKDLKSGNRKNKDKLPHVTKESSYPMETQRLQHVPAWKRKTNKKSLRVLEVRAFKLELNFLCGSPTFQTINRSWHMELGWGLKYAPPYWPTVSISFPLFYFFWNLTTYCPSILGSKAHLTAFQDTRKAE